MAAVAGLGMRRTTRGSTIESFLPLLMDRGEVQKG